MALISNIVNVLTGISENMTTLEPADTTPVGIGIGVSRGSVNNVNNNNINLINKV